MKAFNEIKPFRKPKANPRIVPWEKIEHIYFAGTVVKPQQPKQTTVEYWKGFAIITFQAARQLARKTIPSRYYQHPKFISEDATS